MFLLCSSFLDFLKRGREEVLSGRVATEMNLVKIFLLGREKERLMEYRWLEKRER